MVKSMRARQMLALAVVLLVSLSVMSACASRAEKRTRGQAIDVATDLQFATSPSGRALKLNLYTPQGFDPAAGERLPVVVWIHGGAWAWGSEDRANYSAVDLAREGVAVASVSYSLSDEAQFPTQLGEVRQALVWLQDNSARLGLDMDRYGIWGGSAGGQLALMAGLADELPAGPTDWPRPRFVVNMFGVTDFANLVEDCAAMEDCSDTFGRGERIVAKYLGCKAEDAACADVVTRASPVDWIDASDPPVLTQHGQFDTTVPPEQARRLHQRLKAAGVRSRLNIVADKRHGRLGGKAAEQAKAYTRRMLGLTDRAAR